MERELAGQATGELIHLLPSLFGGLAKIELARAELSRCPREGSAQFSCCQLLKASYSFHPKPTRRVVILSLLYFIKYPRAGKLAVERLFCIAAALADVLAGRSVG